MELGVVLEWRRGSRAWRRSWNGGEELVVVEAGGEELVVVEAGVKLN